MSISRPMARRCSLMCAGWDLKASCRNGWTRLFDPPPLSPPLNRPAVDADQLGQMSHPRGGRALPHDRDQHHHRGEIDLASEEPQRRRRLAFAATIECAAEAEAPIVLLAEPGRTATRLAAIPGGMHHAPAQQASLPSTRNGDVLIKDEKQLNGMWRRPARL